MDENFDAVVIGGGAAGLNGALALARSRRNVLVIDAGEPRNAAAAHVHNFLTRDGTPPAGLNAAGRAEVEGYGGRVVTGRVSDLRRDGDGFRIDYEGDYEGGYEGTPGADGADGASARTVTARRLLLATGARDELPDIPGLADHWGAGVLHCPYCHGWEVRDQRIGILATGPMAAHQALLFRGLSDDVTLLQHTADPLPDEQAEQLEALGVPVIDGEVAAVDAGPDGITGVRLAGGTAVGLDALVVAPVTRARAETASTLGVEPGEFRVGDHLMGTRIETDAFGKTSVPGVWAAGNVADVAAQVVTSAAAGLQAGAAINADLVAADADEARYEYLHGRRAWDARYSEHAGGHHHGGMWSGSANAVLVAEAEGLDPRTGGNAGTGGEPATAFDAGAGEGADALWLARRGWQVTAADLSPIALERGRGAARDESLDIEWPQADLTREPAPGTYDLVTAMYLHIPAGRRPALFAHLAGAVVPGGTLLIVGHDPSDAHSGVHRPDLGEIGWTAQEAAESLPAGWTVQTCEARPRTETAPDGTAVTVHDAILRARRGR